MSSLRHFEYFENTSNTLKCKSVAKVKSHDLKWSFNILLMRMFFKTSSRNQCYKHCKKETLLLANWRKQKPKKQTGNLGLKGKKKFNTLRSIRLSDTQRRCYHLSLEETQSYWRCITWGYPIWRLLTWKYFQFLRTTVTTVKSRHKIQHGKKLCCLSLT